MPPKVVIIGGGYGGSAAAKALDAIADVTLVEPKDAFLHNVGALRAAVDADFAPRIFLPYDNLLSRGRVVRDRAVRVEPRTVALASGRTLEADYIVLATGSGYPFPAKSDLDDSAASLERFGTTQKHLTEADRVLLLGAGPVGLEFAGEIKARWPQKQVVIIDPAPGILSEYSGPFREEILRQLDGLGIELLLGDSLAQDPPTEVGTAGEFTVTTRAGAEVTAQVWFRAYGVTPASDYLAGALAPARLASGHVEVTPSLQVKGQTTVFALGDITDVAEAKKAGAAMQHAEVIAGNITSLIEGGTELASYEPGPAAILLPLGPTGGAAELPGGELLGPEVTAQYKGADLMVGRFAETFGLGR
ncbi:FAD-dependent oxidoreductase [Streptomyces albipurpureus]|uniref:FAD-dependent oxidoreductase n=1 Tax=Streptomyces albipurpureus TaxID=2897419 RepID=A0ABT0UXG3_9ACTN|nr:FAD-dependent oxidoreductase [Streptomyces sp. CWNU-1]MCM2393268.1 FAD-dependent oxidoreductase [Streptomyces sp. CWNU-1]